LREGVGEVVLNGYRLVQVIELDPRNSHAYHNRGISYDKMGRFDAAIADFTKGGMRTGGVSVSAMWIG
jgi:hypothetical protein